MSAAASSRSFVSSARRFSAEPAVDERASVDHAAVVDETIAAADTIATVDDAGPIIEPAPGAKPKVDEIELDNDYEKAAEQGKYVKPFTDLQHIVDYNLLKAMIEKPFEYKFMSPVQHAVLSLLPALCHGKGIDLLVKAKTGTGKTLAFLVPAIQSRINELQAQHDDLYNSGITNKGVRVAKLYEYAKKNGGAVILSPTRELATQLANEAVRTMYHLDRFSVCLFVGGSPKVAQLRQFRKGRPDIIVATPGRLFDVIKSEKAVEEAVATANTLILDEADTLLDLGFKDEIERIMSYMRPKEDRQTLLFSATVNKEIKDIAKRALRPNHQFIDCTSENDSNVHEHIPQHYTVLPSASHQIPHMLKLIAHDQILNPNGKAIIFLPTSRFTSLCAELMSGMRRVLPCSSKTDVFEIHSNIRQQQRDKASDRFRKAKVGYQVLVTSDVSARGVDYPGVTRVIQIGIPTTRNIYVHRVGRTGRALSRNGRGDLVLLPWELGFLNTELYDLPLRKLPAEDFDKELSKVMAEFDEAPERPKETDLLLKPVERNQNMGPFAPVAPRMAELESVLSKLLRSIGDEPKMETFGSLLGFYMNRFNYLRIDKSQLLQALKEWGTEACQMDREPPVSDSMLRKLGLAGKGFLRSSSSGRARGAPKDYRDLSRKPWDRDRSGGSGDKPYGGGRSSYSDRGDKPYGAGRSSGSGPSYSDRGDRGDRPYGAGRSSGGGHGSSFGDRSDRGDKPYGVGRSSGGGYSSSYADRGGPGRPFRGREDSGRSSSYGGRGDSERPPRY
jgi:ATP-dependent RNA helicase MSS116